MEMRWRASSRALFLSCWRPVVRDVGISTKYFTAAVSSELKR